MEKQIKAMEEAKAKEEEERQRKLEDLDHFLMSPTAKMGTTI